MNTVIYIFHKNKVQKVILRCWKCTYLHWHKSYDIKRKFMIFSPVTNLMHHPLFYLSTVLDFLGKVEGFKAILKVLSVPVTYLWILTLYYNMCFRQTGVRQCTKKKFSPYLSARNMDNGGKVFTSNVIINQLNWFLNSHKLIFIV